MTCTTSAKSVAFERFEAICGHPGILRRCGAYGHEVLHLASLAYAPPWLLRIFGGNSSTIIFTMWPALVWITLSGFSSIESRPHMLRAPRFLMITFVLGEHGHSRLIKNISRNHGIFLPNERLALKYTKQM